LSPLHLLAALLSGFPITPLLVTDSLPFPAQLNVTRAVYVTMEPEGAKAKDELKILRNLVTALVPKIFQCD